ncbi:hypothetical protein AXY28_RS08495 [Acinetobacter baumannii]|nr:hypothetical protein [Acinetobacter baumannii]
MMKNKNHIRTMYTRDKGWRLFGLALIWLGACPTNTFYWSKLFSNDELTLIWSLLKGYDLKQITSFESFYSC